MMLLDLLLLVSLYIVLYIGGSYMTVQAQQLEAADIDQYNAITDISQLPSKEELASAIQVAQSFITSLVIYTILTLILSVVLWSIFKSLILAKLFNKTISINYILRFILLNIIWFLIFFIMLVLSYLLVVPTILIYLTLIELLLLFYLTPILYVLYLTKNKIKEAILDSVKIGFGNLYRFILPYLVVIVLFSIVAQSQWIIGLFPQPLSFFISLTVVLAFTAWFRYYIKEIILSIYHNQLNSWI